MNTRISKLLHLTLAATLVFSLGACSLFNKKKKDTVVGTGDGDYVNGTPLADRPEGGVSFTSTNVDKTRFQPVHFAYDSYTIESGDQGTLDQIADFLKGGGNTIIIAGFTDERGTEEYNRGLGEKRAQAVRQYLAQRGADAGRLQTVSFGAEMPVDSSSNESAWAKNRRAEFGVVR